MRNLLTRVPKNAQGLAATLVRSIFAQPSADEAWAQHARVVEQIAERFPQAAELLAEAGEEILAYTAFPKEHCQMTGVSKRQIWSNNPQERLNREIRRRTDVVGIFPNRAAVIRLVWAVLPEAWREQTEQHDEWAVARRYMGAESLRSAAPIDGGPEKEVKPVTEAA